MPKVTDIAVASQIVSGELRKHKTVLLAVGALSPEDHEAIDSAFTALATAALAHAEAQQAHVPEARVPDAPAEAE